MPRERHETITPASFAVAPELLGRPLARPKQRALAMALDLVFIAFLANAGGGILLGFAAAFALWRASRSLAGGRFNRAMRFGAAFVLFVVVVSNWGFWNRHPAADRGENSGDAVGSVAAKLTGFGALSDFIALKTARSPESARTATDRLVARMREQGMTADQMAEIRDQLVEDAAGEADDSTDAHARYMREAIAAAFAAAVPASADRSPGAARDSLARAYLAAVDSGHTGEARKLRERVGDAFAGEKLGTLARRVSTLQRENTALHAQVERDSVKSRGMLAGVVDSFANAGEELVRVLKKAGLGFGWMGLYFTAFVALMQGQTPGKRIVGLRIVRLDGKPMGWWASFERFGGYAASVVTGLSGFFQILWDRNRQGMHDKIAETVVVRER